jgi:ribosome-associated translation inhibitor RaiA
MQYIIRLYMDNLQEKVTIGTKNLKLTPAIKKYIQKKLDFLERFEKYIDRVSIEIADNKAESDNIKKRNDSV